MIGIKQGERTLKGLARPPGLSKPEVTALKELIGEPFSIQGQVKPEDAEKLALYVARLEQIKKLAQNPMQHDFTVFMGQGVWTKDESGGGRVARMPTWPYLIELADHYITRPKVFVEKSRRVLASWWTAGFDVWIAAGGQDPRWVDWRPNPETGQNEPYQVLMQAEGNRQIFLVCKKYEDSCKFLRERVRFIIEEFERRGGREQWPTFPTWRWKENEGQASNGSLITAVAQGSDQLRQYASTLIHCEEVSFWEQAQQTMESALPTLRGGGHVIAISTPQAASYARRLRDGELGGSIQ